MAISYKELLTLLNDLTMEELDKDATVILTRSGECFPVDEFLRADEKKGDMLDEGHLMMSIDYW